MRHVLSCSALALLFMLVFMLGAARPFDRVAAGDAAYGQLARLDDAGLLQGYDLPEGELSRLEVAVLVQQALGNYGGAQLAGRAADPALEQTLSDLLEHFSDELGQLGVDQMSAGTSYGALIQRFADPEADDEEDTAQEEETLNTHLDSLFQDEEEAGEEAGGIDVAMYGLFNLQATAGRTGLKTTGHDEAGDVSLYWGELGWDISHEDWSARFSTSWDDVEENVGVYEAWAKYKHPSNNWFIQLGRVVMPFGNNDYYFPTYPAVNDLGFTTGHTLALGYEEQGWGVSAYAFNPRVELEDEDDTVSDYSAVWKISEREADECQNGWKLRAGYTTHLGNHDLRLAGDGPQRDRVAAYNVFGRYDWDANRLHILADYTAALDEFNVLDLDSNEDQTGDKPYALNTEFIYEPKPDNLYGISYQLTDEMVDYADRRMGLMYGKRLSDLAMLKLEYTHGEFSDFTSQNQDKDDKFVAEVTIAF